MSEILVKTLTRHRDSKSKYYMKDWTAGDVLQIMPDGYFTKNKYRGAKHMGIVLRVEGNIPADYCQFDLDSEKGETVLTHGRSKYIIDLASILTDLQLKDCFNHDLLVDPIKINQSYIDLFKDRSTRTCLLPYDKSGSFDNETVDVGPNGHADANTWSEFESNVAISVGGVIGDCDEDYDDTTAVTISGTGAAVGKILELKCSGLGRHAGIYSASYARLISSAGHPILISDNYVTVNGLQIRSTYSGASNRYGIHTTTDNINLKNLIVVADATTSAAHYGIYPITADNVYIYNTIIYNSGTGACDRGLNASGTAGTIKAYNVTVDNCAVGFQTAYLDLVCKNCVSFGCTDAYNGTFNAASVNNGYSEGADPGGSGIDLSGSVGADLFTDYASNVYKVKNTGALYQAGADLDADTPAIIDDIIGTSRHATTPDIGAFEYQAAGGIPIPVVMQQMNQFNGGMHCG